MPRYCTFPMLLTDFQPSPRVTFPMPWKIIIDMHTHIHAYMQTSIHTCTHAHTHRQADRRVDRQMFVSVFSMPFLPGFALFMLYLWALIYMYIGAERQTWLPSLKRLHFPRYSHLPVSMHHVETWLRGEEVMLIASPRQTLTCRSQRWQADIGSHLFQVSNLIEYPCRVDSQLLKSSSLTATLNSSSSPRAI